jgi:hypothetical protein
VSAALGSVYGRGEGPVNAADAPLFPSSSQKHAEELEGARYGRPTHSTPNGSVVASTEGTTRAAPPFILVLIDGSCAPWTDGLVGQGKTGGLQAAQQVQ